jgi:hypothetical protein
MDSGRFDDTEYMAEMYGSRAVEWLRGEQVGVLWPTDEGKPVTGVCLPFGVPDRTHEVDRTFENETRLH